VQLQRQQMAAASLQVFLSGKCGQIVRLNCGKAGAGTREATSENVKNRKWRKAQRLFLSSVLSRVLPLRDSFRPTMRLALHAHAAQWEEGEALKVALS
jgi:hypothetical protein